MPRLMLIHYNVMLLSIKSSLQLYIAELENQSDIFPSLTQFQPDSQNLKQNTKISFKLKDK